MDGENSGLMTLDVGSRLRSLREERGISMRALARLSGLSANALSMIERGLTSPSVSTLNKLANAMEIPITAFFRFESEKKDVVFRKRSDRRNFSFPKGFFEGLGGESFSGRLEPFVITVESGGSSGVHHLLHSGHEFVFCLKGKMEFTIEEDKYMLEEGDCLIFAAKLQHHWLNVGSGEGKIIVVISGYQEDERPSEYYIASGLSDNND